jgi:hypothetical protein
VLAETLAHDPAVRLNLLKYLLYARKDWHDGCYDLRAGEVAVELHCATTRNV